MVTAADDWRVRVARGNGATTDPACAAELSVFDVRANDLLAWIQGRAPRPADLSPVYADALRDLAQVAPFDSEWWAGPFRFYVEGDTFLRLDRLRDRLRWAGHP